MFMLPGKEDYARCQLQETAPSSTVPAVAAHDDSTSLHVSVAPIVVTQKGINHLNHTNIDNSVGDHKSG